MSKVVPINKGILAKKLGMTQFFNEDGTKVSVTILEAGPCNVIQKKTSEKDGYNSVQLGFGKRKEKHLTKPQIGHFKTHGVEYQKHVKEFRFCDEVYDVLNPKSVVSVEQFNEGELVDITAKSKGMGFTGVMKRYGFRGRPRSHGTHESFRGTGSVGHSATPGRIFKGKKMPGQKGNKTVNMQNLSIYKVDKEKNLLYVEGVIPGAKGSVVKIRDSIKLPSFPYYIKSENTEKTSEESK